jgi:hypothetical protein
VYGLYRPILAVRKHFLINGSARSIKIGLIVSLILAVTSGLHFSNYLSIPDWLFFDAVNIRDFGRSPKVVIVRSDNAFQALGAKRFQKLADASQSAGIQRIAFLYDPDFEMPSHNRRNKIISAGAVERVPARKAWRFTSNGNAAALLAAPGYGIYRQQLAWLPGEKSRIPVFESAAAGRVPDAQSYFVRLSHRQNLPSIDASQIIEGAIDNRSIAGMILLVEPPITARPKTVATARGSGQAAMRYSMFSAAAIQTLADRREVNPLDALAVLSLLAAIALINAIIYMRYDAKRVGLTVVGVGVVTTIGVAAAAIIYANLLLPITAMILLQLAALPLVLQRTELDEDRRLRRFITRTVNLASRGMLMKDVSRLPEFLATTSSILGIKKMALVNEQGQNLLGNDDPADPVDQREMRQIHKQLGSGNAIIDGHSAKPDWGSDVRVASVGTEDAKLYWVFGLPQGSTQEPVAKAAATAAVSYRQMQSLRAELSAGRDQLWRYRPVDLWAGGAVELVAERTGQIAAGIDELDTAIIIFHQIGIPLHANSRMAELYELAGLGLADTDLPSAIAALTTLEREDITVLLHELLLNGGDMRVHCRDFGAKSRNLRIAASGKTGDEAHKTIIIEAIDITDLKYLAELNLTVGSLLNIQLRNDLEALTLAATMAKDERLSSEKRLHILEQISKASNRAKSRLEDVAMRFRDVRSFALTEAYPIELRKIVQDTATRVATQMRRLDVTLDTQIPAVSGYVVAEPRALGDLVEAILQIVSTDTLPGDKVQLTVTDDMARSVITITGGIGMAFDQIYRAIDSDADDAPAPFKAFSAGLAKAVRWGASVTYSSGIGKGYRFNIDMRRIG